STKLTWTLLLVRPVESVADTSTAVGEVCVQKSTLMLPPLLTVARIVDGHAGEALIVAVPGVKPDPVTVGNCPIPSVVGVTEIVGFGTVVVVDDVDVVEDDVVDVEDVVDELVLVLVVVVVVGTVVVVVVLVVGIVV